MPCCKGFSRRHQNEQNVWNARLLPRIKHIRRIRELRLVSYIGLLHTFLTSHLTSTYGVAQYALRRNSLMRAISHIKATQPGLFVQPIKRVNVPEEHIVIKPSDKAEGSFFDTRPRLDRLGFLPEKNPTTLRSAFYNMR